MSQNSTHLAELIIMSPEPETIKMDARKCRFCGRLFGERELRGTRARTALSQSTEQDKAIDDAAMAARPLLGREIRGERQLYNRGRAGIDFSRDDIQRANEISGVPAPLIEERLANLGYRIVDSYPSTPPDDSTEVASFLASATVLPSFGEADDRDMRRD